MSDKYTLYQGDCLEVMRGMKAGSVDAIITDLPYGTTACSWDEVIPFAPMWEAVKHVLKPRGAFVTTASQPFTSKLIMSNLGWFKYCWVWDKKLGGNFLNANRTPLMVTEDIVVFGDGGVVYNPQMTKGVYRQKGTTYESLGDGSSAYGAYSPMTHYNDNYFPKNILSFSNTDRINSKHPTQKPVALYEYLIRTYTNEGETVLDMTAGSFTTGVACLNTNRKFVGIEKDAAYFEIGTNRMEEREDYLTMIGSIPLSYDKIGKGKSGYQARSLFEHQQILEMGGYDEQE